MLDEERPEENLRVAYLGPPATFGHQAALEAFPLLSKSRFIPLPSFEAILGATQASGPPQIGRENDQDLDYALLPVENSTNGGVVPVLDLFVRCGRNLPGCPYPDIEIAAEHYLQIHHCLFTPRKVLEGVANGAKDLPNGASLAVTPNLENLDIKTLYSHPQVWGQCDKFLSAKFPMAAAERINVSSTSAAATFVKQDSAPNPAEEEEVTAMTQVPKSTKKGNKAAICSYLAGSQNDLACIATNIEDEPGANTTRFFIIRNRTRSRTPCHGSAVCQSMARSLTPTPPTHQNPHEISCKSLITFTISHSKPGSLASALDVFQNHNFNLTSINTRPSRQSAWHYVFFVECDEKRSRETVGDDVHVMNMFDELQRVTERATLLGSWVNRLRHPL